MVYVYVPAFWGAFSRGGFHQRRRSPNYINWMYLGQIIVKSTQFGQIRCFSLENSMLMGGKLGKKLV